MSDVLRNTGAGVSGTVALRETIAAAVAPATGGEVNTLRASVRPFACWKIDDMRFAFDSSVVQPALKEDLANLLDLIRSTTSTDGRPPVLSVFGHADPTGADAYNKKLSGRRARAIYALLTRKVEIWDKLMSDAEGTNDKWGTPALSLMSQALGRAAPAHEPAARRKLFKDYMDFLCHSTNPEGDLVVDPSDFLGKGSQASGKADFQGCGEHNPLLLLSERDEKELSKSDRDEANAGNRRVTVLLFRPGTEIEVAKWPCPTASEGPDGCRKRFFRDADQRKRPDAAKRRTFEDGGDTFQCRFYETMSTRSPCEAPGLLKGQAFLAVRVFFHARPMQGISVQFFELADKKAGKALGDLVLTDVDGLAVFPRTVAIGNYVCNVEYETKPLLVCTVFDKSQPEIIVLPVGRPHVLVDGDVEFQPNAAGG